MPQTSCFLVCMLLLFLVQPVTTSHPMVMSPIPLASHPFPRFTSPSCLLALMSPSTTFASVQCHLLISDTAFSRAG